jgi:hypothetical protein
MEVYSRFLAARDLAEALLEQHIMEREADIDAADYCAERNDRRFREFAARMGYRVDRLADGDQPALAA